LTNSADPFTDFVDGVIHGRTGALGRAAGAGTSENKKAGNKDKKDERFHTPLLNHDRSDRFKP
jgi:hypothetical protein